jgi:hypothetical protein
MKTLIRAGASVSFLCCLVGGLGLLRPALAGTYTDGFVLGAAGLFLIAVGTFFGLVLWRAGEAGRPADRHG